jgi:hypothetical protein
VSDRLNVLFCIGCGRLDTPQACPGACNEQAVELVFATDYDALGADPFGGPRKLRELVSRLVHATPHPGQPASAGTDSEREQTYRELQAEARSVLREVNTNRNGQPRVAEEVDRIAAWHCPTCGAVEAPRDCLGICVRRPVEMVPAAQYDTARARYESARREIAQLSPVVRQLAWVTPRPGQWERTGRTLHAQALQALAKT